MENVSSKSDINETRELLDEAKQTLEQLIQEQPDREDMIEEQKMCIRLLEKTQEIEERRMNNSEVEWQGDGSRCSLPVK